MTYDILKKIGERKKIMSNPAIEFMWHQLELGTSEYDDNGVCVWDGEQGLREIALERAEAFIDPGHVRLFVAIIVDAGRQRDFKYFDSESYQLHCRICNFSQEKILSMCTAIWNREEQVRLGYDNPK